MNLFRNPEVRRPFLIMLIEVGFACLSCALLISRGYQVRLILWMMIPAAILAVAVFVISIFLIFKKIRTFTLRVDQSLHGKRDLQFDEFKEGDFAALQDVVQKMALSHARQAEQLEAEKGFLQQSLADITHQIKTPLSSLTLTAEALMAEDVSDAERKRAGRKILDTTVHINDLVATLLKLSRLDADAVVFKTETFSAASLIDAVCEPLEISMELRDITLVKNVPEETVIRSDMLWLKEAIMNIVKNCMEHTPEGGTISIDATDSEVTTQIVISDTGSGIAEEDLPHLFERFYRGKDAGPNSVGIGLAFTNQVVRALGGTVKVKNRPEGGAVFIVRLNNKINV
ncbi:MAG: HAMP domain-containing histidine kinase [Clostridia bacterium]|nr:HAMP domain-containing histidine kinase [Clostridia bacterium]